jgi:hypothetical protein
LRVFEKANHSLCQAQSARGFLGNFQEVLCQPPTKQRSNQMFQCAS